MRYMKRFIIFFLSCLPALPSYAAETLCNAGEKIYFNCHTHSHKTISLCGALPASLQYRFGKPEKIELSYPANAQEGKMRFLFSHYSRAQTDYTTITFKNADADYTLAEYLTDDAPKGKAQLEVTVAGKETDIICTGQYVSKLGDLKPFLPCDPDSALGSECSASPK